MGPKLTRRSLLSMLPGGCLAAAVNSIPKTQTLPQAGEFVRFADPTTENTVVRLTSPAYAHFLPAPANRFVSLKPRVLYCSSDRLNGRLAPFQVDLRTGAIRPMAETQALDPASLTLEPQGRFLYFLDGGSLVEAAVNGKRESKRLEILARDLTSFGIGSSRAELFAIRAGKLHQVQGESPAVLAEDAAGPCVVRPGGSGCLFSRPLDSEESELWYAAASSATGRPVLLARGRVSDAWWSSDGHSVLFLRQVPKNNVFLSEIHEVIPEDGAERCISTTSQFAAFAPNGNDSVFVGASRSKAQPNVVLQLRSPEREFTLCEHRATQPLEVRPAFSPDSRRVYFQSDREGKSAIYSVNVEQLVEPT